MCVGFHSELKTNCALQFSGSTGCRLGRLINQSFPLLDRPHRPKPFHMPMRVSFRRTYGCFAGQHREEWRLRPAGGSPDFQRNVAGARGRSVHVSWGRSCRRVLVTATVNFDGVLLTSLCFCEMHVCLRAFSD
jgi:hypothetical protein